MSETSASIAAGQLLAFIERIERLEADIKDLNADKSDVYKEAKGVGFDVPTIKRVIAARKLDGAERDERDTLFDLYWVAIEQPSRVHVHVREERSEGGDTSTHTRAGTVANLDTKPAASLADEIASKVSYREPDVEVVRDDGVMHEVGRVEGSQARLPSDRAENKPSATL